MACCTADHCAIAQHHHQKKHATPDSEMDCGHGMGEMMDCSMSCCQDSEKPLATAEAFVLPHQMFPFAPPCLVPAAGTARAFAVPRDVSPLSPQHRLSHARSTPLRISTQF